MFQLGSRSDVTSSPTQIPLCAVVNIDIACSNERRNARILSIKIIFSLMKSGKLADFFKRKKFLGVSGTLTRQTLVAVTKWPVEVHYITQSYPQVHFSDFLSYIICFALFILFLSFLVLLLFLTG